MDNQDKIFNKIKSAAHKAEYQDFPGMEKVWARVDEKLDQKALQSKSQLWKKLAIAASVLLFVSLGYQILKPSQNVLKTNEEIVTKDSVIPIISQPVEEVVTTNQIDTAKITKVLKETQTVAQTENKKKDTITAPATVALQEVKAYREEKTIGSEKLILKKESVSKAKSSFYRGKIYDAVEVESAYAGARSAVQESMPAEKPAAANAPLVVINGKITSSPKYNTMEETKKEILSQVEESDLESLIILKEPLYIINGVEYSEESLFGQNPTSPYAPLSKQNIVTFKILQNEEATAKYGDKGKKGVVIITTKNGIPLKK